MPRRVPNRAAEKTLDLAVESEIGIPIRQLPSGVVPVGEPYVYLCDGSPFHIIWAFNVSEGTEGVGSSGSGLDVYRLKGAREYFLPASNGRWSDVTAGSSRGVLMAPIVVTDDVSIGGCAVVVRDEEQDLLTVVQASAGYSEFCLSVAEVLS